MIDMGPAAREALRQMTENLSKLTRVARVLIVDDSHNDCMLLLRDLLEIDPEMAIDIAHNEQEAVQACAQAQYDVIFLDLIFPSGDGATMLSSNWAKSAAHVIVLTGADAESIHVEQAREAGAKVIFIKPVDKNALKLIFNRIPHGQT